VVKIKNSERAGKRSNGNKRRSSRQPTCGSRDGNQSTEGRCQPGATSSIQGEFSNPIEETDFFTMSYLKRQGGLEMPLTKRNCAGRVGHRTTKMRKPNR